MNIFDRVENLIYIYYADPEIDLKSIQLSPYDIINFQSDERIIGHQEYLIFQDNTEYNFNFIMCHRGIDIEVDHRLKEGDITFVTKVRNEELR